MRENVAQVARGNGTAAAHSYFVAVFLLRDKKRINGACLDLLVLSLLNFTIVTLRGYCTVRGSLRCNEDGLGARRIASAGFPHNLALLQLQ